MKRLKFYYFVLFVVLHCFGYELTMQASDKAKEAKTIVVVDLKLLKAFDLLCNLLQKNDEKNLGLFQKLLDQFSPEILTMKRSDGQTLLDFAMQNNTDFKFIEALINKTIKQMILANDQTCLDELHRHFEYIKIIVFLFNLMSFDENFRMRLCVTPYILMFENGSTEGLSNIDIIRTITVGLDCLLRETKSGNELKIQTHLISLNKLLSSSMLHDVTLPLILEENICHNFKKTFLESFLIDNEVRQNWPVEKIIAVLNCYVKAGVDFKKQSATENNLMFLVIHVFKDDFDKCCDLLRYFFAQGCDINEVISILKTEANSLLYYAVAKLKCSLPIILFLLENGANVNEQLLVLMQTASKFYVDNHMGIYTPLRMMIDKYPAIELAQMFTIINKKDLFREPFLIKIQKKSKDQYNNDVILYKELSQSGIYGVLANSDYQEKIKLLMKYGADINQVFSTERIENVTPLMLAVNTRQKDKVAFLLEQGANIFAPTRDSNAMVILKETMKNFRSDENQLQQLKEIQTMFEVEIAKKEMLKEIEDAEWLLDETEAFASILQAEEQNREKVEKEAIKKEKNEKRKAELQAAHGERVKQYNERQHLKQKEIEKHKEEQRRGQKLKALRQDETSTALPAKAIPIVSIRDQKPDALLQNYAYNDLKPEEKNKIDIYLKHLTQGLHFSVPMELQVKYGYREDLLGKKKVEIDISHIFSVVVGIKYDGLNFAGGHMYQTVQNLIQFPIIKSAEQRVDPATQCAVFTLQPVSLNAKSILKTTFPGSWSPEKILEAIVSSEFVGNQTDEEGMEIVYAKTKTSPEIPLKLIFKKAHGSFPTKLVTVVPIPNYFKTEATQKKAGKK